MWLCDWGTDIERERVCLCVNCEAEPIFSKSSPRSPLHILWGVLCLSVCVCHYSHIPQNLPFPLNFSTFHSLAQLRRPSFSDIAKGFIFSSLVSFGDLSMLHFGLDQSQIWIIMLEDAPWFAKKKKKCFVSWAGLLFPTEFAFCQVLYPTKVLAFFKVVCWFWLFALCSTLCFL